MSTFLSSIWMPWALILYLRNWMVGWWKVHFSALRESWCFRTSTRTKMVEVLPEHLIHVFLEYGGGVDKTVRHH